MRIKDLILVIVLSSIVNIIVCIGVLGLFKKLDVLDIGTHTSQAYDDGFERNKPELKELFVETLDECILKEICKTRWDN